MIDPNLRQLLDELYAREGISALNQYADRDEVSKQAVAEYVAELEDAPTIFHTGYAEVISNNLEWSNNGAPDGSFTGRCKRCKQFWFPANMCDKCPDCGDANDNQHTDYFLGHLESFNPSTPVEVTFSSAPNTPPTLLEKTKNFLHKYRHPFS